MSATESGRTDCQRRSPESAPKSATRIATEHRLVVDDRANNELLTTKGGAGIAGRQRIRIKGKLREDLDYHTLSYVLHVLSKRRVDARRKLADEERVKREKPR